MICVSGQSKSRPVKAAGAESGGERLNQKLHAAVWKAHFEVKMYKTRQLRTTFWSSDVEKMHAAVAKRTFASENAKKLRVWVHFLKFWCEKKSTPLWRNAHLQVKMWKNCWRRSTFWSSDVEKMHAAVAKRAFWSKNVENTSVSEHFSNIWCAKIGRRCGESNFWSQNVQNTSTADSFLKFWCPKISQVVR